uniref:TAFII28-like protein domain-containing protein n=1 Tax=Salix viminalis TaxID=40686 RepID=A0A6N2M4M8_SALVM
MDVELSNLLKNKMSRYESFHRSALQKTNMKRLLVTITGSQKISTNDDCGLRQNCNDGKEGIWANQTLTHKRSI